MTVSCSSLDRFRTKAGSKRCYVKYLAPGMRSAYFPLVPCTMGQSVALTPGRRLIWWSDAQSPVVSKVRNSKTGVSNAHPEGIPPGVTSLKHWGDSLNTMFLQWHGGQGKEGCRGRRFCPAWFPEVGHHVHLQAVPRRELISLPIWRRPSGVASRPMENIFPGTNERRQFIESWCHMKRNFWIYSLEGVWNHPFMCSFACPYHNGRSNSFSSAVGTLVEGDKREPRECWPQVGPVASLSYTYIYTYIYICICIYYILYIYYIIYIYVDRL